MGTHPNIGANRFPKQGDYLNKPVRVVFHYGTEEFDGVVVRDDIEEPFLTIIMLADGRHVLSKECQYK